jgi:hypothetical protein
LTISLEEKLFVAPEMFGKRAVIITQCLGAGAKSAYTNLITKFKFSCCRMM